MYQPSSQGLSKSFKRERQFELSLPAIVKGADAQERDFSEETQISHLSANEVTFWLRAKVMIGTKLLLFLTIPRTFLLESPLQLSLSGTVCFVKSDMSVEKKNQLISIKLDKSYQISTLPV
jgi:hypothetical protein